MYIVTKSENMQENYDESTFVTYLMLIPCFGLLGMTIVFEVYQLKEKKMDYLRFWNGVDWCGLLTSIFFNIVVLFRADMNFETLRNIAAIASFCLMLKVYDWFRVFEEMAFYIGLIQQTLVDICYFIILLIVGFAALGIPVMFIQLNLDKASGEDHEFFWSGLITKAFYG